MLSFYGRHSLCFYMNIMKHFIFSLIIAMWGVGMCIPVSAQVVLVKNGKSKSTIIISDNDATDRIAATTLQDFHKKEIL